MALVFVIVNFVVWVAFIGTMTVISRRWGRLYAELQGEAKRQRHIARACTDMLQSVGVDVTVTTTSEGGVHVRGIVRAIRPSMARVDVSRIPARYRN